MDRKNGNKKLAAIFAALAQETRLAAFRLLIGAGEHGLPQGVVSKKLSVPPQTLSFHLKELTAAGVLGSRREGTTIRFMVNSQNLRSLVRFFSLCCSEACGCTDCMACNYQPGKHGESVRGHTRTTGGKKGRRKPKY